LSSRDDFSPIVEQGELEVEGGLFSRLKRRQEMDPIGSGFSRVLLDGNGALVDQQTAGQKYWSRARSWAKVDVSSHALEYEIGFPDPSGLAGFVAQIAVTARVTDPKAAVVERAESVGEFLRPALQRAVRGVHGKAGKVEDSRSQAAVLNDLRLAATENLESLLGPFEDVPEWLSARVTAVAVELDADTRRYREELVGKMHEVAVADAEGESERARARNEIELRRLWEDGMVGRLADPERRALMRLSADPSKQNIDEVAAEFNQLDAERRAAIVSFFRLAVEEGHFPEDEGLLNAFQQMEAQMAKAHGALEVGGQPEQVEAPRDDGDAQVVEAETVETKPAPEDKESDDTDWGK
jgi:hypothetical protein